MFCASNFDKFRFFLSFVRTPSTRAFYKYAEPNFSTSTKIFTLKSAKSVRSEIKFDILLVLSECERNAKPRALFSDWSRITIDFKAAAIYMRELRLIVMSNIIPFRMYSNEEILGKKDFIVRIEVFSFFLFLFHFNSSKQPLNEMQPKIQQNHNRIGEHCARMSLCATVCVPLW